MTDTGQNIDVPDKMSLADMISLEDSTEKRFSFVVDASGLFALCRWVNYKQPRTKDANGAFKLEPHQVKKVVID